MTQQKANKTNGLKEAVQVVDCSSVPWQTVDPQDWLDMLTVLTQGGPRIADIFAQCCRSECWSLEEGRVSQVNLVSEDGVGLRRVDDLATSYAICEDFSPKALMGAAQRLVGDDGKLEPLSLLPNQKLQPYVHLPMVDTPSVSGCVDLLHRIDQRLRAIDPRIIKVSASLVWQHNWVMIINERGHRQQDYRPLIRVSINCVAEHQGRLETAHTGGGGSGDLMPWLDQGLIDHYIDECARQVLLNLTAVDAPAGEMPVILGPGWPGVLLHEAVGHGLEADYGRKGSSTYSGRLGELVASPRVTVVDDGTLPGLRGSLAIDDEGCPTQRNVLIENGVLKSYMNDRYNAMLMDVPCTGNGRRESYRHVPMPRMTNTFLESDQAISLSDMLSSVDDGLYAVNFSGGQVDIASGQFVFTTQEAYRIRQGKVAEPVGHVTLLGHGPTVLSRISMVGNDFSHDPGIGVCGKQGQSVPVTVGQSSVKVEALTVGGSQSSPSD